MPHGFTLLELLITLAILAILSTIAIPGFTHSQRQINANSVTTELHQALHSARQTAINEAADTVVCVSNNGLQCDDNLDWSDGYIVFIDRNQSARYEPTTQRVNLLLRQNAIRSARLLSSRSMVRFNRYGQTKGTPLSFNYCDNSNNARYARKLRVNLQGRVAIDTDARCPSD